jgi:hypothetical protein
LLFNNQSTDARRNKKSPDVDCLDANDIDEEGFIEGNIDTGKVLSTFSFGTSTALSNRGTSSLLALTQEKAALEPGIQNQTFTSAPRGLTPPINCEHYTIKRSYAMRQSTVRKLNALKAEHPDVNVLFNTLVDMAISHYYKYIFNDNGTFSNQEEKKINS